MSEEEKLQLENECLMKYSKAQMIQKYIDELEESSKLSELWCKSQEENRKLKKQLEYLRSGEYYNQLRFENEMLQQVVDTNGVPSEVYDYIDCTHRNTELLKENQELKKQLEEYDRKLFITKNELDMRQKSIDNKLNQQKEFIKYLENGIDICDGFLDTVKSDLQEIPYGVISAGKTYIITRIKENETTHKVYEEILKKYKEIIGVLDEKK